MGDAPSKWLKDGAALPAGGGPKSKVRAGWFAEGFTPHEYHCHRIHKILESTRTRFQECVLADTYSYGRALVLDGETQSTQKDEFIYHECLVQPGMLVAPHPKQVLILGGGEGATAREVLKTKEVEQVVMADIDEQVLEFCMRYLPTWHQGAFENPKLKLLVEDARLVVLRSKQKFDLILSDLPSAIRGGPAYKLYTEEFYRSLKQRLSSTGIFCLQAGSGQILQLPFHAALHNTLRRVFRVVRPYYVYIPSYDVPWAFLFCTNNPALDPLRVSAATIDSRLHKRGIRDLRFIDGMAFEGLFRPPKYLRTRLAEERRVIREDRPVYFFEK